MASLLSALLIAGMVSGSMAFAVPAWTLGVAKSNGIAPRDGCTSLLSKAGGLPSNAYRQRSRSAASLFMQAVIPAKLNDLPLRDYLVNGKVGFDASEGSVGVYAIYDKDRALRFVGQSRYLENSLRIHLGRMPSECYFFRVQTVDKPSRTILDEIKKEWYKEAGHPTDMDGDAKQQRWEQAIDIQKHVELYPEERKSLSEMTADNTINTIRNICRRVQRDIEDVLAARGVTEKLQFAPKLKEQGLLDIATVKIASVDSIGQDTKLDPSLVQKDAGKGGKAFKQPPPA